MRFLVVIARAIAPLQRLRALRRWQPYVDTDHVELIVSRRGRGEAIDALPSVLTRDVPARTADDAVVIIYLRNDTDRTCLATVRARFSTTLDDESGAALQHGPAGSEVELAPGEWAQIGDILGWELDSALSMTIEYRQPGESEPRRMWYDLGGRRHRRDVAGLGEVYEVEPYELKPPG